MAFFRPPQVAKFLMVCMANVCRSPIAQVVASKQAEDAGLSRKIRFDSAGTHVGRLGARPDARAQNILAQRGYATAKGKSRQITPKDFIQYDLVLALDQTNLNDLRKLCPTEHAHKLRLLLEYAEGIDHLDVPDPYYGNAHGFEYVLNLCEAGARGLIRSYQTTKQ